MNYEILTLLKNLGYYTQKSEITFPSRTTKDPYSRFKRRKIKHSSPTTQESKNQLTESLRHETGSNIKHVLKKTQIPTKIPSNQSDTRIISSQKATKKPRSSQSIGETQLKPLTKLERLKKHISTG